MNSQSTLSRTPQESLDIPSQRNAAESTTGAQPLGIYDRLTDAKNAIIDLIKNTAWTSNSSKAQQGLLQTVDSLANIPENTAQLSAGEVAAMEELMRTLEDVRERLKEASTKYGTKDSKKRDMVKHIWGHLDRDGGIQVLEACRTNIETAVNRLQKIHEPLPTDAHAASTQNVPSSDQDSQVKGESRLSSNLSIAKSTFDMVEAVSDNIPLVGEYLGAAAKLGSTIIEMWQGMDSNNEAAKSLESRMTMLAKQLEYFKSQPEENQKEQTNKRIRNLQLELKSVGEEIKALDSKGAITKAFLSRDNAEILKGFQEQIKTTEDEIHRLVSFDTNELLNKLYGVEMNAERRALLARLGDGSYGERGHTIEEAICLEGTREGILQRLGAWAQDASSERVLWISGMAGRGKSTIAATVAHRCSSQLGSAWGLFHFRRGQTALEKRLVCALAKQLESRGTPEIKHAILQAVRENEDIAEGRLEKQFEVLLFNPLKDYPPGLPPILLIVDALDECEDSTYATGFLELIEKYSSSLPQNIKFILTTRPEHPLVDTLCSKEWRTESLDDITEIHHDVELFIRSELLKIKRLKNGLPADWPSQGSIQKLVASSEGLFQWARTAVKYIGGGSPDYRLKEVLRDSSKLRGLDGLYSQILSNAFEKAEESSRIDLLHRTLAALVAAPYPISPEVLAYLFSGQETLRDMTQMEACAFMCDDVLPNIASLLFIPTSTAKPIQLMHTSIRDLLIDVKRCDNGLYAVNLPQAHLDLTRDCFQLMERDLKKNICNLSNLSKPNLDPDVQANVTSQVPSGLQYCCRSWAIHFVTTQESDWDGREPKVIITNDLKDFSKKNLLCWLEVMSLIGRVGEAITMAKQTEQHVVQAVSDADIWLPSLWNDANRFMVEFLEAISFGSLHIYASALPFCPIDTQLWKYYHHHRLTEVLGGQQRRKWSANLWTRNVNSEVRSIIFSPNGKVLALGVQGGTVSFWDVERGEQLGEPMQGHTNGVTSIAFSPDGKMLASGSDDKTVCLWDPEKGEQLGEPMRGHTEEVTSVAFSPDGKRLASGSIDKTVCLWDTEKGKQLGEPMQGHTSLITSVAFFPDGKRLASVSEDNTVSLWDTEKGVQLGEPIQGHTERILSAAFSSDRKRLASGPIDMTVRLWDTEKGEQLGESMLGHTRWVNSVAFSPDDKRLASGSMDYTVRLWDTEKGEQLGEPMQGHSHWVTSVAFSPDGKRLASGSHDQTVCLWDTEQGEQLGEPIQGHTLGILSVAFSSDGKRLASGSKDNTVRLWDTEKGEQLGEPLQGHTLGILSVAFSPDGKRLASGSVDSTVCLWDTEKGEQLGEPMQGHTSMINSVAFSPDGKRLASGAYDQTVRLWDTEKGEQLGEPMGGHTEEVTSVAFSPDGKRLASGSLDKTVRLWDTEKGEQLGEPMQGHNSRITSVAFSPDGKRLASGSDNSTVCLWDTEKGEQLGKPMQVHTLGILSVAFSPDGKTLAVRLYNGQLHWFSPLMPEPLHDPLRPVNHSYNNFPPPFSPFSSHGHWVAYLGSRILWLPLQYWDFKAMNIVLSGETLLVTGGMMYFSDISKILQFPPLAS